MLREVRTSWVTMATNAHLLNSILFSMTHVYSDSCSCVSRVCRSHEGSNRGKELAVNCESTSKKSYLHDIPRAFRKAPQNDGISPRSNVFLL